MRGLGSLMLLRLTSWRQQETALITSVGLHQGRAFLTNDPSSHTPQMPL